MLPRSRRVIPTSTGCYLEMQEAISPSLLKSKISQRELSIISQSLYGDLNKMFFSLSDF